MYKYFKHTLLELKKISWLPPNEIIKNTMAVIIFIILCSIIFLIIDSIIISLIQSLLGYKK